MWISTGTELTHYKSTAEGTSSISFCTATVTSSFVFSMIKVFLVVSAACNTPNRSRRESNIPINDIFFIRLVLHPLRNLNNKRNNALPLLNIIEGDRFPVPVLLLLHLLFCNFYRKDRKPDRSFFFL